MVPSDGPRLAADAVIELTGGRIVLVRRRNPPHGWALPGGFVNRGESVEAAAVREAREETGLEIELLDLLGIYSDPGRDPRGHTASAVFCARGVGPPRAGDDAAAIGVFSESELETLDAPIAFDHGRILDDYFRYRRTGQRPTPWEPSTSPLSECERAWLLACARTAIADRLGQAASSAKPPPLAVKRLSGAFVSLLHTGELRGCIGTLSRDRPLDEVVAEMAIAAGFHDPRFPALEPEELSHLTLEISVLGPLVEAKPEDVIPGTHGVSLSAEGGRAVYLPKVAIEAGWDRERLLQETCLKAGLAPDAWRDPATHIAVFTAEVFDDSRAHE